MKVAVGFDHAGFILRGTVLQAVRDAGCEPIDLGTFSAEPVDFPVVTAEVGRLVQGGQAERGILVCGSGIGACIAANKIKGVYASICHDTYSAAQGVVHDNMNVLCLGGRVVGSELASALVAAFLGAHYAGLQPGGDRFERRVAMIRNLEEKGTL
ncbi:MAG TPA: RpiB/LacA/LacB family sugar-phosphate isomerase [Anaerolineales bacterium]|nr:RpiB/LacA/LacB family sugar-phosphate isomerase [Anaerolineales bacterium]